MEYASGSEFIISLLLIPVFSLALFLLISFIEILDKHDEILFLNKTHTYTNKDLILPLIIAVTVGLLFYAVLTVK